jgi:hypothetical protein
VHARLLVVIPLFFLSESWVNPRMTEFVRAIAQTGIVPTSAQPALRKEVARIRRWNDAWWPEAVFLFVAVLLALTKTTLMTLGASSASDSSRSGLASFAYFDVSLTVFRFVVFLGVWKLTLWSWFLWRVSRLDLQLLPGHPDRDGGLGLLQLAHERFYPVVAAISVLESAAMAEAISAGTFTVASMYPSIFLVLVVDAALFLGPLFFFTDKMSVGRTKGIEVYASLAARYVTEFEAKWIRSSPPADEPLLGTADLQSLADLNNAVGVVRTMRWVTIGQELLILLALAALVPLAPLLLFQYPLTELAQNLFHRIMGL